MRVSNDEYKFKQHEPARFTSKSQFHSTAGLKAIELNNLDGITIDHLSCRPRTASNVGIDQLVNTQFRAGKSSFQRHERFRPEMLFGDKDYDIWHIKCSESCDAKIRELDLGDVKCLSCENVVTRGDAQKVFTVLYPLIGKIFFEEFTAMQGKLKPKNKFEDLVQDFPNLPFEKAQFKQFVKNKAKTIPKRTAAYMLIRNQWAGFEKSLLAINKLQRVLRCSGFKKQVEVEDAQTTLINNDIVELKMPAVWLNSLLLNVTKNDNMAFNQQKLWTTIALGQLEQFQGEGKDQLKNEAEITEDWNKQCKEVREWMIHLWTKARHIKCGDDGQEPPKDEEEKKPDDGSIAIDDTKKKD